MVVISTSIKVDFAPGEHVETAINDALKLSAFTKTPVKFRFNGISMTINPPDWALTGFKCTVEAEKQWKEDAQELVDSYVGEYHTKCNRREARFQKKMSGGK